MKEAVVLLVLVVTVATQTPPPSNCLNGDLCTLSCSGCNNGDLVHDPEDCHNYFMCLNQQPMPDLPLTCPDGEHFNATAHECQAGDECVGCVDGSCHYQCTEGVTFNQVHSLQFDCSTYVVCNIDGDEIATLTCPEETPYFDGTSCQTDESKCCSCQPFCTEEDAMGQLVFDPIDCTKYYFCVGEGIPENFGKCDDGQNFDSVAGGCSEFAPCSTPPSCVNVVGPDGCIAVFTCETIGAFAKCQTQCIPEYFSCRSSDLNNRVNPLTCINDLVYNPVNHQCIPEEDCPFTYSVRPLSLNNTLLTKKTRG